MPETHIPTPAEVKHYEEVIKPKIEAAKKEPTLSAEAAKRRAELTKRAEARQKERQEAARKAEAAEKARQEEEKKKAKAAREEEARAKTEAAQAKAREEAEAKAQAEAAARVAAISAREAAVMLAQKEAEAKARAEVVVGRPEIPPTPEEIKHYEEVIKPQLEAAVAKVPKEEVEIFAAKGSEVAAAVLEKSEGLVYSYEEGKFVLATIEEVAERVEFYGEHPEIAPPGTPGMGVPLTAAQAEELAPLVEDYEAKTKAFEDKWDKLLNDETGKYEPRTKAQYEKLKADIEALSATYEAYVTTSQKMMGETFGVLTTGLIADEAERARYKAERAKYADWTAEELLGGKLVEGVFHPSPWEYTGGVYIPPPDWVRVKHYEAQLATLKLLDPYKIETETGKFIVRGTPEHPLGERLPEVITTYDLPQAIIDEVPEVRLKLAGFTDSNIADAKAYVIQRAEADTLEAKYEELTYSLKPYTKSQINPLDPIAGFQDVIDVGEALADKAVTEAELKELGYTQEAIEKAKVYHEQGWKVWIPIWGTVATWRVSSELERGIAVVGDVLLIVPVVGWLGKAGSTALKLSARQLAVGIAPKVGVIARTGAAAKAGLFAAERLTVAPITFPIQVVRAPGVALKGLWEITKFPFAHPLETVKGIGAITTGKAFLGEPTTAQIVKFFTKAKTVPMAAVAIPTKGTGVQRVFVSHGLTEGEALEATRLMQLRLSNIIASGRAVPRTLEVPVYEGGKLKLTIRFPTTRAMRELGLASTATPFAERVFTGAAEPIGKGKVYFSTAMSPEWTGVSARGLTTPEAIEMGRGGALFKDMRINRLFDPVSRAYRHSIEVEMTVPTGTQMVTGREAVLDVLKTYGNVKAYPSVVMEQTATKDIIAAARASLGKQFEYRPIDFTEIRSLPKGSAKEIEAYIRAKDMMVGGSTAERTWTRTIKLPEDMDLISLRNNAKVDAENLARVIEQASGFKARATKSTFRNKWDLEWYDPKTNKWVKVGDVLDYRVHKTYNPDILNREPVKVDGIKVEHPLEQTERIAAKYAEYQKGEVPFERHRGHPKRLAWMAETILDTPGGKLTKAQIQTLKNIGGRIDYTKATWEQLLRLKIGGVLDSLHDTISPRRVEIILANGQKIRVPKTAIDELNSFIKNRPNATMREIEAVTRGINDRILLDNLARLAKEGELRLLLTELVGKDPLLREAVKPFADNIEALLLHNLQTVGRFTPEEIRVMIASGVIAPGAARALTELTKLLGEAPRAEVIVPTEELLPEEIVPEEVVPIEEVVVPIEEVVPEEVVPEVIVPEEVVIEEERVPIEEERVPIEEERVVTEEIREVRIPVEEERVPIEEERAVIEEERVPPEEVREVIEEVREIRIPPEEVRVPPREERVPREPPYRRPPRRPYERPYRPPPPPYEVPPPPPPPPPPVPSVSAVKEKEVHIPPGSIAWKQGALRGGVVWKYIPPPWDQLKPITLVGKVPAGAVRTEMKTPRETIQLIGEPKARVPETVSIDLGVVDIYITDSGRNIQFKGGGLKTIVGERISVPEKGMSIPAKGLSLQKKRALVVEEAEALGEELPKVREAKRRIPKVQESKPSVITLGRIKL